MRMPFRRKSLTVTPTVVDAVANRTVNFAFPLANPSPLAQAAYLRGQSATYGWLYRHRPAVRMVIDYIATNCAEIPMKLYEKISDEDRQRSYDHPAAQSLDHPDEGYSTTGQFLRGIYSDFLVYDRACILKFRDGNGGPLVLLRMPPTMVLPAGTRVRLDFYRVFRTDGSWFDVQPEDMIHWHGYNPDDPLVGWSKLETLRDSLTEDQVSQATTVELLKNGLKGGHIERPLEAPEWSPEAQQRFREQWANQRSASPRLDPVLEEGMTWKPTAITPKDAELLAGRQWTVDEVAAVYNFPADLLRRAAGEAGELVEARKQFYQDLMTPLTTDLACIFDDGILLQEYDATDYYFEPDLNAKLRGDPVQRFQAITSAVGAPWLTRNEARALENRPAVPEGDELITPMNVIVGDNPLPAANVMPPQNPNGPAQDGSHRQEDTTDPNPPKLATVDVKALPAGRAELMKASEPLLQLAPRKKGDLARQQRYTDEALAFMSRFYTRQSRALRKKAAGFDNNRWDRELAADMNDLLTSIVEREAGIYVARLAGDDFDMRYVVNYLKATSAGIAEAVNDVTEADIEELGVEDAMSRALNERAAVVAASLGAKATIFARMEAAKQAPQYELRTKTWVADTERHAEFDGDTVPIEEDWPAGFAPGSPPNCGCTATIN